MKTIFITGASSGLGKATAKLFQAKGWNVIATMRNPEKGITSIPILNDRKYLEVFGMIIQPLSFEIIQAIQEVDPTSQLDMLQTIDQEKPALVVTHIYQGTQADEMEWPLGELIIKANNKRIHHKKKRLQESLFFKTK